VTNQPQYPGSRSSRRRGPCAGSRRHLLLAGCLAGPSRPHLGWRRIDLANLTSAAIAAGRGSKSVVLGVPTDLAKLLGLPVWQGARRLGSSGNLTRVFTVLRLIVVGLITGAAVVS